MVISEIKDLLTGNEPNGKPLEAAVPAATIDEMFADADTLQEILEAVHSAIEGRFPAYATLGQALDKLREVLLDHENERIRAVGVHIWRAIVYQLFRSQQSEQDYQAISYAVMDGHNYFDRSSNVNVESMEAFFDATDPRLVTFVDRLIAFQAKQEENEGQSFAGYASLRFTGPTRALLGPQLWPLTCAVEVSGLADLDGSADVVEYAEKLALADDSGCTLHWGQRNNATTANIQAIFGQGPAGKASRLERWRAVLGALTDEGRQDGFSNEFTRRAGLEVNIS